MFYCSWGCDVIGMINMLEVKFVCEVEICYVIVVMVMDYDSWYLDYGEVDIQVIIKVFYDNVENVQCLVGCVVRDLL